MGTETGRKKITSKNAAPGQWVRSIPRTGSSTMAVWEGFVTSYAYQTEQDKLRNGPRAQYYVDILKDGSKDSVPVHCQYMWIIQDAPDEP